LSFLSTLAPAFIRGEGRFCLTPSPPPVRMEQKTIRRAFLGDPGGEVPETDKKSEVSQPPRSITLHITERSPRRRSSQLKELHLLAKHGLPTPTNYLYEPKQQRRRGGGEPQGPTGRGPRCRGGRGAVHQPHECPLLGIKYCGGSSANTGPGSGCPHDYHEFREGVLDALCWRQQFHGETRHCGQQRDPPRQAEERQKRKKD